MFHTCLRSIFNNFPLNTYVMSRVLPEMLFAWVPSSQTTLQWERILLNWKITIRFQFQFNDISDGNFGTIDLIWCISLGILNTEDKSWSLSFFRIKMFQCFPTEIIFLNFVDKVILLEKLNNWLSNKQNSILPVHTTLTLQSSIIILQQSVNFLLKQYWQQIILRINKLTLSSSQDPNTWFCLQDSLASNDLAEDREIETSDKIKFTQITF